MKYLTRSIAILIILMSNAGAQDRSKANFFPLRVGDEWNFNNDPHRLRIQVVDTSDIYGYRFYVVQETSFTDVPPPVVRRKYYTIDSLGNVLRLADTTRFSGVYIWYKSTDSVDESWKAMANSDFLGGVIDPYKITIESRTDTVITSRGVYCHCLRFHIDNLTESDTDYWDWFAVGVGIVKRAYGNYSAKGWILTSYKLVE